MVGVRFPCSSFFRLANPFPRHLYHYSFQNNPVYCQQDMILTSLLAMVLSLAFIGSSSAQDAQVVLDSIHNSTGLPGTWSSGAKNVLTGAVSLFSFHPFYLTSSSPPRTLQILAICRSLIQKQQASLTRCAYSRCLFLIISLIFHHCFSTGDGYYESSRYRFTSNGVLKFQRFLALLCTNFTARLTPNLHHRRGCLGPWNLHFKP